MLWIPVGGLVVAVCALALIAVAYAFARRRRWWMAAMIVAGSALMFRAYAADHAALHPFDERYHALVAKHMIEDPLVPMLYADPVLPYDRADWHTNHVWLHKPPLALWLQAASMSVFGVSEWPMRLPSVLLATVSVLATFGIGWMLFSPHVALTAAVFHALNGFLVDLASGRRASDHVDTVLIVLVQLTMLIAIIAAQRRPRWVPVALGVGAGLAWMTKSVAGLLVLPLWLLVRLPYARAAAILGQCGTATIVMLLLALPWAVYTWLTFPVEARHESAYALRHMTEILEGQGGPLWGYLTEMPRYFGESIYIPLLIAVASVAMRTASPARKAMLLWIALPYGLYSLMATKMPAYVMVAAPAMFLIQADVWIDLYRRFIATNAPARRIGIALLLFLLAVLPARHLLNPSGPLEAKSDAQWASDLRNLNAAIGPGRAVIFNVPTPIEAMFYTPYVAYEFALTQSQVRLLRERGYRVYRYQARTSGSAPAASLVTAAP